SAGWDDDRPAPATTGERRAGRAGPGSGSGNRRCRPGYRGPTGTKTTAPADRVRAGRRRPESVSPPPGATVPAGGVSQQAIGPPAMVVGLPWSMVPLWARSGRPSPVWRGGLPAEHRPARRATPGRPSSGPHAKTQSRKDQKKRVIVLLHSLQFFA